MKNFKVIDQLCLIDGVLKCKKPSGRSYQKAHFKQGELDGACGVYSIAMVLNILGVFEAEELNSDTEFDERTAEWRIIKALNENGLYRDGLSADEIVEIIRTNYSKYVNIQTYTEKEYSPKEFIKDLVDENIPSIIRIRFQRNFSHWVVVVGYEEDDNSNPISILTLDPSSKAPSYCLWNGVLNLERYQNKIFYPFQYYSDYQTRVGFGDIVVISRK